MLGSWRFLVVTGPPDDRLSQLLEAQHACVSRRQLLAAGLTDNQIRTRTTRHQLELVHLGVYTAAGIPELPLRLEAAALLACGPAAVLGLLTAAEMWKLLPPPPGPSRVSVLVTAGSRGRSLAGIDLHRTTTLTTGDIRHLHGLPLTSPERTLIDLASLDAVGDRQLEHALDEALGRRITSLTKLTDAIAGHRSQPGAARLKRQIAARTTSTITKSDFEARFLKLIRQAGLPDPQTQARFGVFEVDAYWPHARFAVEFDSYQWHRVKTNFERDRRKDRTLQRLGIQVTRITWSQMRNDALELIADIATTIAQRARDAA